MLVLSLPSRRGGWRRKKKMKKKEEEEKERGAALPLTAHYCGLRLCGEAAEHRRKGERKEEGGGLERMRRRGGCVEGGSIMKVESQLGLVPKDRLH